MPSWRKSVPYNGPPAPPTVETNVIPTVLNNEPTSPGGRASILASTAWNPRFMLIPWSASPIAESSSVRYSLFSAIVAANVRIIRTTSSYGTLNRATPLVV